MHYLNLTAALAEDRRRQCPCGAVAEPPLGVCRKCHARMVCRRKARRASRHAARRQVASHGTGLLVGPMSLHRTTSKGAER
jgi:hypothetical protein